MTDRPTKEKPDMGYNGSNIYMVIPLRKRRGIGPNCQGGYGKQRKPGERIVFSHHN